MPPEENKLQSNAVMARKARRKKRKAAEQPKAQSVMFDFEGQRGDTGEGGIRPSQDRKMQERQNMA